MDKTTEEILFNKASTLMEALPWIKHTWGRVVVIKYGGAAMTDPELRRRVADDIVLMKLVGVNPVVVHGGGPEISKYMKALNMEVEFIDGVRVTSDEAMDVVKMVLVGKVNKELVNSINFHGRYAVGISGEDGGLVHGVPISVETGRAGRITTIDTTVIENLLKDDFIPVVATTARGEDNGSLNVNADAVAAQLAQALGADKCLYLTDVDGLYRDFSDKSSLISQLNTSEAVELMTQTELAGGMGPKVRACVEAVQGGVRRAHILNGTIPHALLLEIYTDTGVGTMITNE